MMFKRFRQWLTAYRDKLVLSDKIKLHAKQDSFIYPWYHDQKN